MKKLYSLCLLALLPLLTLALAGCSDDDESSGATSTSAITLNIKFNAKAYDGQLYYWNQDQQMVVNVSRDPEASGPGTSITRVEYYLDDTPCPTWQPAATRCACASSGRTTAPPASP